MRTAFIEQLIEEAKHNDKIFLIVGDLGFSVVEPFAEQFPDRFLNAGIAEQNMVGIAAGLATEGYNVFIYSIGNFPTLRCMEQIRYDICYHNLSVKIVAVGGGYAYGSLGVSHHTTEEIGMLRTIPNLCICVPGDPIETRKITTLLCNNRTPSYIRLGKAGEPIVHEYGLELEFGKGIEVIDGIKTAVLSTGSILYYAREYILANKLDCGLFCFPFIKPIDYEILKKISSTYQEIITIEEHQKSAGFGSAILEGFNDLIENGLIEKFPNIKRIAIPDMFISIAGSQEYLRKLAGLVLNISL